MQSHTKKLVRDLLYYDRKELITLNLFWIGFILYTVSWTISKSTQVNFVICQLLQIVGMLIFIPASIRLMRFRFGSEYQKILFILLLGWACIIFLRGLELDKDALKRTLLDPWFGGFLYFAPVIMLFPQKLIYYKKAFAVTIILAVFYVVYDFMFISDLMEPDGENILSRDIVEYFSKTLSVTIAFILLTYVYHSKPKIVFAFFVLLLTIFFAMVRARRGLLFMTVGPMFFIYLVYWFNSKNKFIVVVTSAAIAFVVAAGSIYYININSIDLFELLAKRGVEDTRSGIERYFYGDMEGMDWVIGRGMKGEYYSPTVGSGSYRGTIETDYLNIILKGGLINLFLIFAILVPAIFNGVFRSSNTLSKAAGIWIFLWMLNTYPSTVQVFTLNYLLVWISVGICYSKTIRDLPEKFLTTYFHSPSS